MKKKQKLNDQLGFIVKLVCVKNGSLFKKSSAKTFLEKSFLGLGASIVNLCELAGNFGCAVGAYCRRFSGATTLKTLTK